MLDTFMWLAYGPAQTGLKRCREIKFKVQTIVHQAKNNSSICLEAFARLIATLGGSAMVVCRKRKRRSFFELASSISYGRCAASLLSVAIMLFAVSCATSALAADCGSLAKLTLKDTTIASASVVPPVSSMPEYCKVTGQHTQSSAIDDRVRSGLAHLEMEWQILLCGRRWLQRHDTKTRSSSRRRICRCGSDTGHKGDSLDGQWALNNLQAQVNYAYLATHVTTLDRQTNCQGILRTERAAQLFRGMFEWRKDGANGSAALSR